MLMKYLIPFIVKGSSEWSPVIPVLQSLNCLQANSALYNQTILLTYSNTLEEELKILEMGRGRSVCIICRQTIFAICATYKRASTSAL